MPEQPTVNFARRGPSCEETAPVIDKGCVVWGVSLHYALSDAVSRGEGFSVAGLVWTPVEAAAELARQDRAELPWAGRPE